MLQILQGDCLRVLPTLLSQSVQCCVSSPPYWGLRDYGIDEQLGLEQSPEDYVANMVAVFREVRRVLRDKGTLWLNLGDSYATGQNGFGASGGSFESERRQWTEAPVRQKRVIPYSLKPKDLIGIPWRVALALQADGWYLRSDIIWHKPNPMPESVTDRPTKAHEYIFLLTKSERYFYNAEAIKEKAIEEVRSSSPKQGMCGALNGVKPYGVKPCFGISPVEFRNRRTVWTIATQPYAESHFATFPEELPKLCILAGSKPGDTVLDPFAGSGTTGKVALELGRKAVLIELNPAYIGLAQDRCNITPGFTNLAELRKAAE